LSREPTLANQLARLKLAWLQTPFSWLSQAGLAGSEPAQPLITPAPTTFNNKTSVFEGLPAKHRTEATHP